MRLYSRIRNFIEAVLNCEMEMDVWCNDDNFILHTIEEIEDKDIEKIEFVGKSESNDNLLMIYTLPDENVECYKNRELVKTFNTGTTDAPEYLIDDILVPIEYFN